MKKLLTISYLAFTLATYSQIYNGTGGAIQNTGQDTYFTLNVSGMIPTQLDSTFGLQEVCLSISHPDISEINIFLKSPSGTLVELTQGSDCSGTDYTSTCFNSGASTSITLGTAPYTGSFKPLGYMGRFNTGQAGNGTWTLVVKDWLFNSNSGTLVSWSLSFGNAPAHPVVFTSSNLPIVFLNTTQPISDTKIVVTMGVIDNGSARNNTTDSWNNFNGKAAINLHGSTTKNFEKKCYNIETRDMTGNTTNVPLLGMPSENDWDLMGYYADKALMRIPFTYELFRRMGHYASRTRNVEVVINNEYMGLYAMVEKPKRDSNRVHVSKMTTMDNYYPNVTGGYIFKIDRTNAPGWTSLLEGTSPNNAHFYYQYVYPNDSVITTQQMAYIKAYMDTFETVMGSSYYKDPNTGYMKYIHRGSFIDFFIVNELSKNPDAYRLSTYLYKDNLVHGGKLHIGPVWDYDLAWHNCNYGNASNPAGWQYQIPNTDYPSPNWWNAFMQDTAFTNALNCRWKELRQNVLDINTMNNYIDSTVNALSESQARNFIQWPILGTYISPNPQNQSGATYATEVADLKNWLVNRVAWLDGNIPGSCKSFSIEENSLESALRVYPNPMQSSATFELHLSKNSDVSLCITDIAGKEVARFMHGDAPPGESKITFEKNKIAAGLYLYQLQIGNATKSGKIVIQ